MLTSPFQQPSTRQKLLAGQIHEATGRGDEHRLLLLQTQWVHRFGVETLPVELSGAIEINPPQEAVEHPAEAVVIAEERVVGAGALATEESQEQPGRCDQFDSPHLASELEQGNGTEQVLQQGQTQHHSVEDTQDATDEAGPFERFRSLPSDSVDVSLDADLQHETLNQGSDPEQKHASLSAVPVPAPPIRTPRSLRRWLPGGVDGLAEAS